LSANSNKKKSQNRNSQYPHKMFTALQAQLKTTSKSFQRYFTTISSPTSGIYRPRRALLYMPGSSEKMLGKASTLPADTICMDLEDAVASNQKPQARHNITATLEAWQQSQPDPSKRSERLVRINPVGSGFEQGDIDAILSGPVLPDGIVLPKVNHPDHVKWLHEELGAKAKGRESQKIIIIALIESAKALLALERIAESSDRLDGFIFGGDDFAADIGATRTSENKELLYARQHMLVVGKAYGLQCIDIVNIQFQNSELFRRECEEGFQLGFTGKQIIHPKQIEIAHECFAPSAERVQWAQRIVDESKKFEGQGMGAFSLDGHMIDMPTIKQAQNVLMRYKACNLR